MKIVVISFIILSIAACQSHKVDKKTVVCIPVYGQSLALGRAQIPENFLTKSLEYLFFSEIMYTFVAIKVPLFILACPHKKHI